MGGGQSSLFWSQRTQGVTTIESDPLWFEAIKANKQPNQEIYLKTSLYTQPDQCYATFATTLGKKFDVIVIDGGDIQGQNTRMACAKIALNLLLYTADEGAMIILDNADWHKDIAYLLRKQDLIEIDFHGFGPINCYTWTTSIFITRNFNFKPLNDVQPHYSLAAIHHDIKEFYPLDLQ